MLTWEIVASGRVQGVGFRRFVQSCAQRCQITGWTKNLHDGNVQIEATGERRNLAFFLEHVRSGRGFIRVDELSVKELDKTINYEYFNIR
ncbi:MAG: acylphosphatase [Candidatus Cloacimonetes bacterium]|nr:acylphosphatase [Candidatus Cloacimonadota bacterium]